MSFHIQEDRTEEHLWTVYSMDEAVSCARSGLEGVVLRLRNQKHLPTTHPYWTNCARVPIPCQQVLVNLRSSLLLGPVLQPEQTEEVEANEHPKFLGQSYSFASHQICKNRFSALDVRVHPASGVAHPQDPACRVSVTFERNTV